MKRNYVIHTKEEIPKIRHASRLTAGVRDQIRLLARPGMSTYELDQIAGTLIGETGGYKCLSGIPRVPGEYMYFCE